MRYHQILSEAAKLVAAGHVRLYRGDSSEIAEFDIGKTSLMSLFGRGIYLTDKKRVAGDYVSKGRNDDVIFKLSGRNLTKQQVLDYYLRQLARKIDEKGQDHSRELIYWSKDVPYSDGGDFGTVVTPLRHREHELRMGYARERWQQMAKTYEVRVKLDNTGVIQRKAQHAKIAVFDVPESFLAKCLHADYEAPEPVIDELTWVLDSHGDKGTANDMRAFIKHQKWEGETPSFRDLYTSITADSPLIYDDTAQLQFIEALQELGYNGIEYIGGVTMGGGYRHRAFVVWDAETLNRYRVA